MFILSVSAPPKLLELGAGGYRTGGAPRFRTGSGRSISVRETSVQNAKSFLEGGDAVVRGESERNFFVDFL